MYIQQLCNCNLKEIGNGGLYSFLYKRLTYTEPFNKINKLFKDKPHNTNFIFCSKHVNLIFLVYLSNKDVAVKWTLSLMEYIYKEFVMTDVIPLQIKDLERLNFLLDQTISF